MLGIFGLFINFWSLAYAIGLLLVAVGIYFTLGPVKLAQLALDARVWMVVIIGLIGITLWHDSVVKAENAATIKNQIIDKKTGDDGKAVIIDDGKRAQQRGGQAVRIQHAIDTAKPDDAFDSFMDQVGREQATDTTKPAPSPPPSTTPATVVP